VRRPLAAHRIRREAPEAGHDLRPRGLAQEIVERERIPGRERHETTVAELLA
jgi:hypothetical protein